MLTDYVSMSIGSMALQPLLDYSKVSQVLPSEPPGQPSGKAAGTGRNSCLPQFCWEAMKARRVQDCGVHSNLLTGSQLCPSDLDTRPLALAPARQVSTSIPLPGK